MVQDESQPFNLHGYRLRKIRGRWIVSEQKTKKDRMSNKDLSIVIDWVKRNKLE